MTTDAVLNLVREDLEVIHKRYGSFQSADEGYAILLDEVDRLAEELKRRQGRANDASIAREAVRLAAMAVRFLTDLYDE